MYDHDQEEVAALGWEEFIARQWESIFVAYRTACGLTVSVAGAGGWVPTARAGLSAAPPAPGGWVRAAGPVLRGSPGEPW